MGGAEVAKAEKIKDPKKEPQVKRRISAFKKPLTPDKALAAIVGKNPLPRTEVTKRLWKYIRENNLQDPKDRRTIRADKRLKPIFEGKDSVTMFELTKLVNQHLLAGSPLPGKRITKRPKKKPTPEKPTPETPKK